MKVKDVGESGVIRLLTEMVTQQRKSEAAGLMVDVGDDAAAWQCDQGIQISTTDTMVEGVHFTRLTTPWYDLGWKLMASNASDIAAMGSVPLYALITLGLPPDTEVDDLRLLYQGMLDLANRHGIAVVGGDVVRSPVIFVTAALSGVHEGHPMLRSGAVLGDQVAVTGYVGSAAGGLEVMVNEMKVGSEVGTYLRSAHRRPQPCIAYGRLLSGEGVVAAMDVSDGLVDDLSKLCMASGVSARVYAASVPIHSHLKEAFPKKCLELALNGGEDYQLLFTAEKELMDRLLLQLGSAARVVGEITAGEPGSVTVVDVSGACRDQVVGGWDHFR